MIPLAYVTHKVAVVDTNAPNPATNKPHLTLYGSVEGDLVARSSHDNPLFRKDNAEVYYFVEEATRRTSWYSAS